MPDRDQRRIVAQFRDLVGTRDGATYFAERVWGVSLRYDLGGGHPLVGRSVPDFELADGTRAGELLRTGTGLLLDFDAYAYAGLHVPKPPVDIPAVRKVLPDLCISVIYPANQDVT